MDKIFKTKKMNLGDGDKEKIKLKAKKKKKNVEGKQEETNFLKKKRQKKD